MFDAADDDDNTPGFSINKSYAEAYGNWREKEELQKLKDKYGNGNGEDESSSEASSDDLDPEDLRPELEKDFLTVLSALKSHDPAIYDAKKRYFDDVPEPNSSSKLEPASHKNTLKKEKPLYLKDYERKIIIENQGNLPDEEQLLGRNKNYEELPYVEQQAKLKESFKINLDGDASDADSDDLLKPREKTTEENKKEEEEYVDWLKGVKDHISKEDDATRLNYLHDYWNNPKLDDGEKFLKDFILNKRYLNPDSCEQGEAAKIPSYNEIVGEDETQNNDDLDDDAQVLEKQENFEHKYNFRYEEPDEDFIKSYPRTVKDSLRRKDERNKLKRDTYKEKKEKEKEQKREEIKRLKNLKRKEISEKLKKIKNIIGDETLTLDPDEFEKDFDPADYDKKMRELFNENYYSKDDDEKPEFSDDSDAETDEEQVDNLQIRREENQIVENGAKTAEEFDEENHQSTSVAAAESDDEGDFRSKSKRKRKKSKFLDAVFKRKPLFDPNEKTFEQYFDEYYKLDYEDIIGGGDTVCRFKYRQVVPNDFGLTTEEILNAKPKELNAWASVKKMSQYRVETDELYDVGAYKKKAEDKTKKQRILFSVYHKEEPNDSEQEEGDKSKTITPNNNRITKAMKNKSQDNADATNKSSTADNNSAKRKRRKRKNKASTDQTVEQNAAVNKKPKFEQSNEKFNKNRTDNNKASWKDSTRFNNSKKNIVDKMDEERLKAYGLNPKKFKNKMKYKR